MSLDFDRLAADYDRLRPAGDAWEELSERTLAGMDGCRRLVDVGCGTGRFAVYARHRLGARVWGVDPSAEMLQRARARPDARGIGWKRAVAEQLPFRDGWFDAAHMHLVVHTLTDRSRALAEIARVLGRDGRLAIATFATVHFDRFFLNPYFPSLAGIDRARFPDPAALAADLAAAGFTGAHIERISRPVRADPDDVLERVRGRYISTLHLLDADERAAGLGRLEAEVQAGREAFAYSLDWALLTARRG
ncbi:MAG: class I SAM-dependent methyltransferase [Gaiellales bacterium]